MINIKDIEDMINKLYELRDHHEVLAEDSHKVKHTDVREDHYQVVGYCHNTIESLESIIFYLEGIDRSV